MDLCMDKIKMAEKLWDLANLVTGFAVAQSIATTFVIAKGDLNNSLRGPGAHFVAIGATLIFTVFYIFAILWCRAKGSSLDSSDNSAIWCPITAGRVFAVVLFTSVTLGTLYGHWNDESRSRSIPNAISSPSVK